MPTSEPFQKLCFLNELNSSALHKFCVGNTILLATLDANGQVFAFSSQCPHSDKPLHHATWDPTTRRLTCNFHWVAFDFNANGLAVSGPKCESLRMFPTEIITDDAGNKVVYINLTS